ncbi:MULTISPECIES: hypothetical protein [unclassified Pseudonocardia]|uniref:hypothetical protein n=1 Tax=unclassified Pseudonocardia TaxID=2619320 RepID=UPI0001FFE046|nr:hypothetical protein [Pseudonocardia sp. Ae707_Ps1]OLM17916.1 hypothetical protein Ae707Ps1_2175 [Pseudonocardia sp. Ae707_Ps1]
MTSIVPEWATGVIDTNDKMITIDTVDSVDEHPDYIDFVSRGQRRRVLVDHIVYFVGENPQKR